MKLDINELHHQYIIRVVIFSVFLFKGQIRSSNSAYKLSVISFVKKRLPWDINLKIDTGIQLNKDQQRDIILDEILNDIENDNNKIVTASFRTPLKDVNIQIDIRQEDKYQTFLYS